MIKERKGISEAEKLLEELGFGTLPIVPTNVVKAIDSSNFKVQMDFEHFDSEMILGKAIGNDKAALIYVNSNIPDAGRKNFTAAHEIGHVCMHIMAKQKMSFECGAKELSNSYDDPVEREANGFASGLLMPKNLISPITDGEINWANIHFIKEACGTSLEATYRRMCLLEKSPYALVIHKDAVFYRFVATENFDFYIDKSPLTNDQLSDASDVKSDGYTADLEESDASEWVNPKSKGWELEIIYSSTILLDKGFSYTLLTYDDDCLSDASDY